MNHRLNAKLHRLPSCLECSAHALEPCTNDRTGRIRAPHRVREMMASGQLLVATRDDARRIGALRSFERLVDKIARTP